MKSIGTFALFLRLKIIIRIGLIFSFFFAFTVENNASDIIEKQSSNIASQTQTVQATSTVQKTNTKSVTETAQSTKTVNTMSQKSHASMEYEETIEYETEEEDA